MKRLLLLLALALILCTSVLALSEEELFQMVLENSPKALELRQTRRSEVLEQVISSMSGPSWSLSLQSLEVTGKDDLRSPIAVTFPSLEVGVSSPENPNNLSYEARLSIGGPVFNWDNATDRYKLDGFSYSLRTGLSKGFEFKSWDTTNYQQGMSDLMKNNSYRTSILQLENAFIEDLIKIVKWSQSVRDINTEALLLRNTYESDIRSGKLVEGSPDATIRFAEVEMKEKEAEQALDSGEETFAEFKNSYGFDPVYVDASEEYNLDFNPGDEVNTEVRAKYYEYLTILQQIDEKTGKSSQFSIKASLEPKVTLDENFIYKSTSLSGELSASYKTGNINVDMSFNAGYDFRGEVGSRLNGPTLSVSFSWSNTPQILSTAELDRLKLLYTNYSYDKHTQEMTGSVNWTEYEKTVRSITNDTLRKESLELEKLQYEASAAEMAWREARNEYMAKCSELQDSIREYKNKKEVFLIKYEADKKALAQAGELLDQGKTTVADYMRIEHLVEMDQLELLIYKMQSHILFNNIEMLTM